MRYIKHLIVVLGMAFFFSGCGDEEINNGIPYKKVDFQFYPYAADSELASYGAVKKFSGQGYNNNGVLVCQLSTTGEPAFLAFDATCPKEADFKTGVVVDNTGILKVKCPKCGTVYDLRSEGRGGNTILTRYNIRALGYQTYYQVWN